MKELMPWYRSSDEIKQELGDTMASCSVADASMSTSSSGGAWGPEIDVIRIRKRGTVASTKAVIVFGEHARELISPESAVDFVKNLCGNGKTTAKAQQALEAGAEFVIVPNANPIARRKVEDGYWCKRTNEDGVDLNRNWGSEHRNPLRAVAGDEMNPGPEGFSEPETQILRDLVAQERPDIFLSVHSGAYLLGAPFGYKHGEPANEADVAAVLKPISDRYCNGECPYGSLADMINYKSEGCDIDWVSEHVHVPYAFTWEIYVGPEIRDEYVAKARARAGDLSLLERRALRGRIQQHLGAGELLAMDENEEDPDGCRQQFLPLTESETRSVVENWSGAYMDLALEVADRKRAASTQSSATSTTKQSDEYGFDLPSDGVSVTTIPASISTASADSIGEAATTADASYPRNPIAQANQGSDQDIVTTTRVVDVASADAVDADREATSTTSAAAVTTTDEIQAMRQMFAHAQG